MPTDRPPDGPPPGLDLLDQHTDQPEPRGGHGRQLLAGFAVLGLLFTGIAVLVVRQGIGPFAPPQRCTARVSAGAVLLSFEQAENASIIAGVAIRRGLPARAVTIALATAYQESGLRNLDYGDRDSLGLFQQRPSQGWGTPDQIRDPHYASGAFYDALVKVRGYQTMAVTVAAQRVQRSGFPNAYADHESDARMLASALTGQSPAGLSCVVRHGDLPSQTAGPGGLTERGEAVRRGLLATYGPVSIDGFDPTASYRATVHTNGQALDIAVATRTLGWVYASYLVANAKRFGIEHVVFADRIWTAGHRSADGWRPIEPDESPDGGNTSAGVHVDVRG